jgi:hypothetical protein
MYAVGQRTGALCVDNAQAAEHGGFQNMRLFDAEGKQFLASFLLIMLDTDP